MTLILNSPLASQSWGILKLISFLVLILSIRVCYAQEESFGGERPPEESMCETPDILLLLDRSGSMLDDNKWGQATNAISDVFVPYFETLRFGLMTFPSSGSCGVTEGELAIQIGEASGSRLEEVYQSSTPTDEALTPLSEAIRIGHMALTETRVPNRRSYLILLTDGIETCAPVALEDSAPIAAAREAANDGFNTYVIGFGSLVKRSTLREMARVGGTERERLVSDQTQLSETLTEIIDSATTERCDRLDNDCDGRVDEGLDCGPRCNARIEECPCDNNQDCQLGESCEEGLCAPAPCSTLCDQGYICFEDECIRESAITQNGGTDTSSNPPSQEQFGGGLPPVPEINESSETEAIVTPEGGCDSRAQSRSFTSLILVFAILTVLGMILKRERRAREE